MGALGRLTGRKVLRLRLDFVEIFDDDRRIRDDLSIMIECRYDPIGIQCEIETRLIIRTASI